LSNLLFVVKARLKHFFSASGPKKVHSPYLYELYRAIKDQNSLSRDQKMIVRNRRRQLAGNSSALEFDDPGSRGGRVQSTVAEVFKRTSKPSKQALSIAEIAAYGNEGSILELGTAFGTTTMTIRFANGNRKIVSVEGVTEIASFAKETLGDDNNTEIIIGRFADVVPDLAKSAEKFGMVFMDGHHSRKPTLDYLETLLPALDEKALVVIDDIYYSKDMFQCWQELLALANFQVKLDFFHFGVLVRNSNLSPEVLKLRI
jgi:hypothetical protein